MLGIHRHYDRVRDELRLTEADDADHQLPRRGCTPSSSSRRSTSRRCAPSPTPGPRGRPSSRRSRSTSSPMRPRPCRRSGNGATSRCRSRPWTARSVRSPARWSSTSRPPQRPPPGCGRRVHPRVRGGPLVRAAPAQPERAAPQGPAALHPGVMVASVPWQLHSPKGRRSARRPVRGRRPARRMSTAGVAADLSVGDEVEVDVGPVAHGGHCVARHEGRVVFVRHTLPGSGCASGSPRASPGSGSCGATPCRGPEPSPHRVPAPVRMPGPACAAGATSSTWRWRSSATSRRRWCASSSPGWLGWTCSSRWRRCPETTRASAGAPAWSSPSTRPGRPACAGTARMTCSL